MTFVTDLQYRMLKTAYPASPNLLSDGHYASQSKLDLLGKDLVESLQGKTVLDFGCGTGTEALAMVHKGAKRVIGLDIQENLLQVGRQRAAEQGLQNQCVFVTAVAEPVDAVVSLDAFEHFADPDAMLGIMASLLQPGGEVYFSFGPTWFHPLGGHLFSVFPWAHVLLSEQALVRWRSDFKSDGATRFCEVAGGLNRMTIRRFEELIGQSRFQVESMECVPIGRLKAVHTKLTREFTSSLCRGRLILAG